MNITYPFWRIFICAFVLNVMAAVMSRHAASQPEPVADQRSHTLMPAPASIRFDTGSLRVDSTFHVVLTGHKEERLERAALRLIGRLSKQTGIPMKEGLSNDEEGATLLITCEGGARKIQEPVEDESYSLVVNPRRARLGANSPYGVLRGIETFLQLVSADSLQFSAPCVAIKDAPRFPWRGLLIDVCRHWMPLEVIKRNLDAMAAARMNVLHWHLSEDQGFRIESKKFPELQEKGSGGLYFTQEEVREVLRYASDRGIRVIPEFDMPGHSTSWLVSHPELAGAPGPYQLAETWGIFDAAMDPTNEDVYAFIDQFVEEMSSLFPDPYFHIGGDEVTGKQWKENSRIQEFERTHGMKTNHDLQVYFNRRLLEILQKHGKKMVGWDEILHPDLPKDIVVQSWRGQKRLEEAAKGGYQSILSYGYYLDHLRPASYHYANDPIDQNVADLSAGEKALILGGEACMWCESVTRENIDSRIWPRCAAIAERLWSPADTRDVDDMYRRLQIFSERLEWLGVNHTRSYTLMLQRLSGNSSIGPLKMLADVLEPIKLYQRIASHQYLVTTPLNRMVDAVRPESDTGRRFSIMVDQFLADSGHRRNSEELKAMFSAWRENHEQLMPAIRTSFLLREIEPLSRELADVARIGMAAIRDLQGVTWMSADEEKQEVSLPENAGKPQAELLLTIVPAVRRLVEAAHTKASH